MVLELIHRVAALPSGVQWVDLAVVVAWAAGVAVVPPYLLLARSGTSAGSRSGRLVTACALGVSVMIVVALLHKTAGLGLGRGSVLGMLAAVYGLAAAATWRCGAWQTPHTAHMAPPGRERVVAAVGLAVAAILAAELVLRTRGSSLSRTGDETVHLCMTAQTLVSGPFYDRFTFAPGFHANWYAGGFSSLAAMLCVLSGRDPSVIMRYLPVMTAAAWVVAVYALAFRVSGDRRGGMLAAFLALGVSGGFNETARPVVVFFNPWALSWVLAAASLLVFLDLVEGGGYRRFSGPVLGLIGGAAVLLHPLLLWRFIPFVALPAAWLAFRRRAWIPALAAAALAAAVIAWWTVPLYLRHGLWPTLSMETVAARYGERFPDTVAWVRSRREYVPDGWEMLGSLMTHAGFLPIVLAALAVAGTGLRRFGAGAGLVVCWMLTLAVAARLGWTSRPTRLFEFLHLAMVVASGVAYAWWTQSVRAARASARARQACLYGGLALLIASRLATFYAGKYAATAPRYAAERVQSREQAARWWETYAAAYAAARDSEDGASEYGGGLVNFLTTNNADFWRLYAERREREERDAER